jgi:hypothetical protein
MVRPEKARGQDSGVRYLLLSYWHLVTWAQLGFRWRLSPSQWDVLTPVVYKWHKMVAAVSAAWAALHLTVRPAGRQAAKQPP